VAKAGSCRRNFTEVKAQILTVQATEEVNKIDSVNTAAS